MNTFHCSQCSTLLSCSDVPPGVTFCCPVCGQEYGDLPPIVVTTAREKPPRRRTGRRLLACAVLVWIAGLVACLPLGVIVARSGARPAVGGFVQDHDYVSDQQMGLNCIVTSVLFAVTWTVAAGMGVSAVTAIRSLR